MKVLSFLPYLLFVVPVFSRDFRPEGRLESITADDSSIQECYVFPTIAGVGYTVEISHDLLNWTAQDEIYGLGHDYVVTMREFTPPPPPPPGTPPSSPVLPAKCAFIRMQRASGLAGGIVVSWSSLDDRSAVIVRIAGTMVPQWDNIPHYSERYAGYYFFVSHPILLVEPPAENPLLGPKDAAMLVALEANLANMNQQVSNSAARVRNAPAPLPPDPNSRCFWRINVDWGSDTDTDGTPDWAEFEIAARDAATTPPVRGDAFNADTNHNNIRDGEELDTDQDGTPDSRDPNPTDNTASFPIGPVPRYALFPIIFPITNAQPSVTLAPLQISDRGTVLYRDGTWTGGIWTPLNLGMGAAAYARAVAINDSDQILGSDAEPGSNYACYWSNPAAQPNPVEFGNIRAALWPEGTWRDNFDESLLPGPLLANDGGFYAPAALWGGTPENRQATFQHYSRWKIPGNGQPASHTQSAPGMRCSTGLALQWGYSSEAQTAPGNIQAATTIPAPPFTPTNVIIQPGGSVLAMPVYGSDEPAQIFSQGIWKPSSTYARAIDIAADGTAIGRNYDGLNAPICVNGKWTDIARTVPIQTDVFDPPPQWHDDSVALKDTTPSGWVVAQRGDFSPYNCAVLLPIRTEGYYSGSDGVLTEAVGVDDFSIGSEVPGNAVQDRIWIMAPQGGFNKNVKFKAPLNSNTPLNLSASNILFNTQESVTISNALNPVTLRAADTVSSGGERLMTVIMGTGDNEISSISKPIGLKIMKGRTVKVTVYKLTKLYGTTAEEPVDQFMMPTQEEIANYIKDIFRPQINVIFDVNLVEVPLRVRWDANNDGEFDVQTGTGPPGEEAAILAEIPANPAPYDIRVFLVANKAPLSSETDAYGLMVRDKRTCWVLGSRFGKNRNKPFLLHTIAHEIGHVIVGEGHPDSKNAEARGKAPLPGTQHNRRLMCSGPNSNGSSHLLVKGEWDEAEKWLKEIPDKRVFDESGITGSY